MEEKEILIGILAQYFKNYKFFEAISKVKEILNQQDSLLHKNWKKIKLLIDKRLLEEGEALRIIAQDANLPLDEDIDKEAYKWLALLVKNLDSNNMVDEY